MMMPMNSYSQQQLPPYLRSSVSDDISTSDSKMLSATPVVLLLNEEYEDEDDNTIIITNINTNEYKHKDENYNSYIW